MKKTKLLKRILTGTLAATLLLAPVIEPMQGVFFENGMIAKAADSDFVIKNGVLIKYQGEGGDVVVPEGVTRIEDRVFSEDGKYDDELDREMITSIILPKSLKSIGKFAFENCDELEEIEIPNNVTSIEYAAFSGCGNLRKVTLSEKLTCISALAFAYCSIEKITIPKSVKTIESEAFTCCSLTSITFSKGLTKIGQSAFQECNDLTSIKFPNSLKTIEFSAFYQCEQLTSVIFPDSLTKLGDSSFAYCWHLTDITFPKNMKNIDEKIFRGSAWAEERAAIRQFEIVDNVIVDAHTCEGDVVIPNGVTGIGPQAFSGCTDVTSITIPDSVEIIGENAFENCTSLSSITIPGSVKTIDSCAFWGCSNLSSVTMLEGVTTIYGQAFYQCSNLSTITIPRSVTTIYSDAFLKTKWFKEQLEKDSNIIVNDILIYSAVQEGDTTVVIPDNVTKLAEHLFSMKEIKSITIPSNVTSIGDNAFEDCSDLETVVISGCAIIGADAFNYCQKLKNLTLAEGVTEIGDAAFYGCFSLENVVLPNTVTTLGDNAFSWTNFNSITIPKSVTTIGGELLKDCGHVVIYGEKGSKIQSYAKTNGYPFALIGTTFTLPGNPTLKTAKRKSSTSLKITYEKVEDADGYEILYSTNDWFESNCKTVTLTGTSKTLSKLTKNKTYYVKVRAYKMDANNKKAYGSWSETKKVNLKK